MSRVLLGILGVNAIVATLKILFGTLTGSLSLLADGFHSVLDASSNVVGLVGISVASKPPDAGHPYGHSRFEAVTGFVIGILIAGGTLELARALVDGIVGARAPVEPSGVAAGVVAGTVVVNIAISRFERRRGRELGSSILEADAAHTLSDAFGAMVVLASMAAAALGHAWVDLLATGVVLVLVARTAWDVIRSNAGALVDTAQLDPMGVHRVAIRVPGVEGAHRVRSRGRPGEVFVDLHIHVDPAMSVDRAHLLTHEVSAAIRDAYPEVVDVIIHTEPADGRQHDLGSIAPADGSEGE